MKTSSLATAAALSDRDLLARLGVLAGEERHATVELIAHLAALDERPDVYLAEGYGSLFSYCTQALHLSEDAACNRVEAARTCRRSPVALDLIPVREGATPRSTTSPFDAGGTTSTNPCSSSGPRPPPDGERE
jgi:hypothetical protein